MTHARCTRKHFAPSCLAANDKLPSLIITTFEGIDLSVGVFSINVAESPRTHWKWPWKLLISVNSNFS